MSAGAPYRINEQGHERVNFGIRRSKFKVTRGRNRSKIAFGEISQELFDEF